MKELLSVSARRFQRSKSSRVAAFGRQSAKLALTVVISALVLFGVGRSQTDGQTAVPPEYYTKEPPGVGETYEDPVFGTTIKRVTDASRRAGAVGVVPVYSQSSMFNLNDTYMSLVATVDGSRHLYDGNGKHLRRLNGVESEPRWSRINPNHLYFRTSRQIRRLNVATGDTETLASFGENISFGRGTGDVSDNERIVVLRANRYISVWDLANGVRVSNQELDTSQPPINGSGIDYVTISKGGDSFVVGYNSSGLGRGQGIEQFDVNGNFMAQLWNHASHAAMGRDVNGEQVYFIANSTSGINCDNGILKIRLDGSAATSCLMTLDWSIDKHLSAHGNDGWVYLSTFQPQATPVAAVYPGDRNNWTKWHPYTNEIFRVRADGTVVERLAHHRSRAKPYWVEPHASISISGNKLVYGSDFHLDVQTHYADTYLIDLTEVPLLAASTALSPSGTIVTRRPTYTWTKAAGAERYLLWIDGPRGNVHTQWHEAWNICFQGICSVTSPPLAELDLGAHMFGVTPSNAAGEGFPSAPLAFNVGWRTWRRMGADSELADPARYLDKSTCRGASR